MEVYSWKRNGLIRVYEFFIICFGLSLRYFRKKIESSQPDSMQTRDHHSYSAELPVTVLRKVCSNTNVLRRPRDARAIALTVTVVTVRPPVTFDFVNNGSLDHTRPEVDESPEDFFMCTGLAPRHDLFPDRDPGAGFRIPCPPQPLRNCRNSRRDLPTREDTNGLDIIDTPSDVCLWH